MTAGSNIFFPVARDMVEKRIVEDEEKNGETNEALFKKDSIH